MEENSHLLLNNQTNLEIAQSNENMPPPAITTTKHKVLVTLFAAFSIIMGYIAATHKKGWRFFSYHPLFMTLSFVGLMGSGAVYKKLGVSYTHDLVSL